MIRQLLELYVRSSTDFDLVLQPPPVNWGYMEGILKTHKLEEIVEVVLLFEML